MDEGILLSVLVAAVVVVVSMGLRSSLCRRREPDTPPTLAASSTPTTEDDDSSDEDDREPSVEFVAASTFMANPPVKLNLQPTQQLVFYSLYKQVSRLHRPGGPSFLGRRGARPCSKLGLARGTDLGIPLQLQPPGTPTPPLVHTEATVGDNEGRQPSMLEMTGRAKW